MAPGYFSDRKTQPSPSLSRSLGPSLLHSTPKKGQLASEDRTRQGPHGGVAVQRSGMHKVRERERERERDSPKERSTYFYRFCVHIYTHAHIYTHTVKVEVLVVGGNGAH